MKRLLAAAALAVSVIGLTVMLTVTANAATTLSSAPAATGYARCPAAYLCIFNGANGTGEYCTYSAASRADAVTGCGFEQKGWLVRSVWNRHSYTEQFYKYRNFSGPSGYALAGDRGNASGCCQIRSFAKV